LDTVTPGSNCNVSSTFVCVCPGAKLSGRSVVMANGKSSGDRSTSRVTVTAGRRRADES
jgi:hypothetical protein